MLWILIGASTNDIPPARLFVKSTVQAHENLDDLPDPEAEGMPAPSSKKKKKQQLTKAAAAKAADFSTSHLKFKEDGCVKNFFLLSCCVYSVSLIR